MTSHQKRLSILEGIMTVAWADGSFEDRERALMARIVEAFGHSAEAGLPPSDERGERKTLREALETREEREYCYQQAAMMSYADGRLTPSEWRIMEALKRTLDISDSVAAELEAAAAALMD